MKTMPIVYHDLNPEPGHQQPEGFTTHYSSSWTGDVLINVEEWRVTAPWPNDERTKQHGYELREVRIPFGVLVQIVAEAVRNRKISELENIDDEKLLGLKRPN